MIAAVAIPPRTIQKTGNYPATCNTVLLDRDRRPAAQASQELAQQGRGKAHAPVRRPARVVVQEDRRPPAGQARRGVVLDEGELAVGDDVPPERFAVPAERWRPP